MIGMGLIPAGLRNSLHSHLPLFELEPTSPFDIAAHPVPSAVSTTITLAFLRTGNGSRMSTVWTVFFEPANGLKIDGVVPKAGQARFPAGGRVTVVAAWPSVKFAGVVDSRVWPWALSCPAS